MTSSLSVLIVDDIEHNRVLLTSLVGMLGYRHYSASSGEEALALFESQRPDIVLLDLLMPGMDGFTVCRCIKEQNIGRWVPVVVLSGLEGEEHLLQALQAQADDFLHKPINPAILASKLGNLQRQLTLQAEHEALLARSRAISINSFDATLLVNPAEQICEANPAAVRLLDCPLESLLGLPLSRVLPGLKRQSGTELSTELQVVEVCRPNGLRLPAEAGLGTFEHDEGRYLLVTLRDISERVHTEQLKQQFIATLSHELRTPLTSIIGALKMLRVGSTPLNDQQDKLVDMADRNAGRLLGMVNQLLDLNRALAGKLTIKRQSLALAELLADAHNSQLGYAARHNVNLTFEIAAEVEEARLDIDHDRFVQIMGNLISNACKFSPAQGTVTVRAEAAGREVAIHVIDHGPGIPEDFLPQLFEPFTQADAGDTRQQGGSGLGLTITQQLVGALDGRIQVRTGSDQGCTFTVSFPRGSLP